MKKVSVTASVLYERTIEIPDEMFDRFVNDFSISNDDYFYVYNEMANLLPNSFEMEELRCIVDKEKDTYLAEW